MERASEGFGEDHGFVDKTALVESHRRLRQERVRGPARDGRALALLGGAHAP
jgi:hypothetical protein